MIVSKFGGSATTTTKTINTIKQLAKNKARRVLVFSAIGKIDSSLKLTDILIKIIRTKGKRQNELFAQFFEKIKHLCTLAKIDYPQKELLNIKQKFITSNNKNYLISRGEYITAKIMASFLKIKFISAEKLIYFKQNKLDETKIKNALLHHLNKHQQIVIPGFYGVDENNNIKLFSRGGSDTTAGIVAKLLNAKLYENWTDVDCLFAINPKIAKSEPIEHTNYADLFIQTKFDANIINHACVDLLKSTLTTLKIKNIFNPASHGTTVTKDYISKNKFVVYKKIKNQYLVLKKDETNMFHLIFTTPNRLNSTILKLYKL